LSLIALVTPAEIEAGRKLTARVAELLGGREFVLVVAGSDPDDAGDIFSNTVRGHDFVALLENALASTRELRKSRQS